jgi:3-dehydroquinate dehydratase-1
MGNYIEVRGVQIGKGIPKICVPIVEKTKEEIWEAARALKDIQFDVVEWRADWFDGVLQFGQVESVLKELRRIIGNKPILFTFRTLQEGGQKPIDTKDYAELIKKVAATKLADLVDVEAFLGDKIVRDIIIGAHAYGVQVVASNHDFQKTPEKEELVKRLCKMQDLGADIPKIAVMPRNKKDVITLLSATQEMVDQHADRPIITMSMASDGLISRLCGEIFGSALTFGAVGKSSAPGQMDATELRTMLNLIHKNL